MTENRNQVPDFSIIEKICMLLIPLLGMMVYATQFTANPEKAKEAFGLSLVGVLVWIGFVFFLLPIL